MSFEYGGELCRAVFSIRVHKGTILFDKHSGEHEMAGFKYETDEASSLDAKS
jgi:hypothetical protein